MFEFENFFFSISHSYHHYDGCWHPENNNREKSKIDSRTLSKSEMISFVHYRYHNNNEFSCLLFLFQPKKKKLDFQTRQSQKFIQMQFHLCISTKLCVYFLFNSLNSINLTRKCVSVSFNIKKKRECVLHIFVVDTLCNSTFAGLLFLSINESILKNKWENIRLFLLKHVYVVQINVFLQFIDLMNFLQFSPLFSKTKKKNSNFSNCTCI